MRALRRVDAPQTNALIVKIQRIAIDDAAAANKVARDGRRRGSQQQSPADEEK